MADDPSSSSQPSSSSSAAGPSAQRHTFWETQPVVQARPSAAPHEAGPIDPARDLAGVRPEPYRLPKDFEWCTCNLEDPREVEEVYTLLTTNYVEDDDGCFRFNYSAAFLDWALRPPGYHKEWHVGIRVKANRKMVAFISGIPGRVRVGGEAVAMTEINFLCVHKRLRSKRLAPVLIKEITRRVHQKDVWQAVYTAGIVIPTPIAACQYWHRTINPKKLIDIKFSRLSPNMTLKSTIRLYKLPDKPATPGLRPLEEGDLEGVLELLQGYLGKFQIHLCFETVEEVRHWLLPRPGVVFAYVATDRDGRVTDLCSFYSLPSSVLNHRVYNDLQAAYSFYTVATSVPLATLMNDALILARDNRFDVFNALDLMEYGQAGTGADGTPLLKELKFGIGDGKLHYYLYNWRMAKKLEPEEVGLVML